MILCILGFIIALIALIATYRGASGKVGFFVCAGCMPICIAGMLVDGIGLGYSRLSFVEELISVVSGLSLFWFMFKCFTLWGKRDREQAAAKLAQHKDAQREKLLERVERLYGDKE